MSAIGELRDRLVLEEPVETPDGAGGVVRSHAAVTTLWAKLTPLGARDHLAAASLGGAVTHRIVIRVGPTVTTRHRFRLGGRVFRIVAWREYDRFLDIRAEERTD